MGMAVGVDSRIGVDGDEVELVGETVLRVREADLVVGMADGSSGSHVLARRLAM